MFLRRACWMTEAAEWLPAAVVSAYTGSTCGTGRPGKRLQGERGYGWLGARSKGALPSYTSPQLLSPPRVAPTIKDMKTSNSTSAPAVRWVVGGQAAMCDTGGAAAKLLASLKQPRNPEEQQSAHAQQVLSMPVQLVHRSQPLHKCKQGDSQTMPTRKGQPP